MLKTMCIEKLILLRFSSIIGCTFGTRSSRLNKSSFNQHQQYKQYGSKRLDGGLAIYLRHANISSFTLPHFSSLLCQTPGPLGIHTTTSITTTNTAHAQPAAIPMTSAWVKLIWQRSPLYQAPCIAGQLRIVEVINEFKWVQNVWVVPRGGLPYRLCQTNKCLTIYSLQQYTTQWDIARHNTMWNSSTFDKSFKDQLNIRTFWLFCVRHETNS